MLGAFAAALVAAAPLQPAASSQVGPRPSCADGLCSGLSAADVLRLAGRLQQDHDLPRARALLLQVLQDRQPKARAEARFQLAQIAEKVGDLPAAERWYRALLDEMPAEAIIRLELGRVLAEQRKTVAAGRELRRAHAAGLPPDVAKSVERIVSLLRHDAPYGGSFEVAVAPDSNINRSTRADTVTAFGLPFALDEGSRGRSGVGVAFASQLFARLPMGDHRLVLAFSSQGNRYKHRAANDTYATLTAGPQFRFGDTQVSANAVAGRSWQGGKYASDSFGIDTKARFALSSTAAVALGAAAIHERNRQSASSTGMSYATNAALEVALSPRLYARSNLSVGRVVAGASPLSAWSFGVGLTVSRQFGAFTAYGGGEIRHLRGDAPFLLFGRARRDTLHQATVGLIARPLTVGGFAPVVRVTHSRNRSPIELYGYTRNRVEFGITRDF